MAYKDFESFEGGLTDNQANTLHLDNTGDQIDLPDASYIRDANIMRDGMDLVLDGPNGTIVVDDYFSGLESPNLVAPSGETLSPELVNSFVRSAPEYAQDLSMNDASPIGSVDEISGDATITRTDGTQEPLHLGSNVYQGDIIETADNGAVNITFTDESSFAVSEDTRLAIDEYVFDPSSEAGAQNFSVLKGVFVYTSGLIGRDDPDDVQIDTPSGSIGIRGTIIAGDVNSGEITVVEGAIVLRTPSGHEMTLASAFETGQFNVGGGEIKNLGQLPAKEVAKKFSVVSKVAPKLFSSINDAAAEDGNADAKAAQEGDDKETEGSDDQQDFDAEGTTDGDGDSQVDGTVDEATKEGSSEGGEQPAAKEAVAETTEVKAKAAPLQQEPILQQHAQPITQTTTQAALGETPKIATETFEQQKSTTQPIVNEPLPIIDTKTPPVIDIPRPLHLRTHADTTASTTDNGQINVAPDDYFKAAEGQSWDYHFNLEFSQTAVRYELSTSTKAALQSLFDNGIIINSDFQLDPNNGHLHLQFASDIDAHVSAESSLTFDIQIAAFNAENEINIGGYITETFTITNDSGTPLLNNVDFLASKVFTDQSGNYTGYIATAAGSSVTDNKFYLGDGFETLNIGNNGNGGHANNNYFNLGNGGSQVYLNAGTGNTIVGGFESDTYTTQNMHNKFYGMDGDDTIRLDLSNAEAQLKAATIAGDTDILMDAGHSDFRALDFLKGQTSTVGRGDTLQLDAPAGAMNIDFTQINDNYIRGIERIELTGTNDIALKLSYQDIIEMTDHNNTLIIRADNTDSIEFDGIKFSNFTKTKDDFYMDDNATHTPATSDDTKFDVYSDGNVTLIIEDTGAANITGLPAA